MLSEKTLPIVGIDLGTTFSSVAYFNGTVPELIKNDLGEIMTPSAVAIDSKTQLMTVGRTARDILALSPASAAFNFKRNIGTDRKIMIRSVDYSSIELSAYVLDALRQNAAGVFGEPPLQCVVTVPAYFNDAQRFATKQAAELAGFITKRVLNEPTAAAIAYGLHRAKDHSTFLVFDLGGGTFDVCVMELFDGVLEVKSVAGISQLGGEDFTHALSCLILKKAGLEINPEQLSVEERIALHRNAELLKRSLSRWERSEVTLNDFSFVNRNEIRIEVSAEEANKAYAPLLSQLLEPCYSALRGARIQADDLDEIILVGGATKMPIVQQTAKQLFNRQPLIDPEPDLLVVRGAAIQAGLYEEQASLTDIVVTDICSHSLGIDTSRSIGRKHVEGYFSPIIHRNTVVPTSRTEEYRTISTEQTQMNLEVYEGESLRVKDNTHLGTLVVSGIPPGTPRQTVEVTFTYDLNGLLEVEAIVVGTEKRFSKIFLRNKDNSLSDRELEEARARMSVFKRRKQDRPRYRDLVTRAELLWKDLSEQDRERLGIVLQRFEQLLAFGTENEIEELYNILLELCVDFDNGERW